MIKVGEYYVYRGAKISVVRRLLRGLRGLFVAEIVEHPPVVAILPFKDDGKVVLVKQYRYTIERELYEIPAGTLERGEDPVEGAKRELLEETGYIAETLDYLDSFYPSPGSSTEVVHVYVAKVKSKNKPRPEVDEEITTNEVDLKELILMMREDKIVDAKTLGAVALYLAKTRRLDSVGVS